MQPEVVSKSPSSIQWEDSDTEEAQDNKARQKPVTKRNATQILDIPGNEVFVFIRPSSKVTVTYLQ